MGAQCRRASKTEGGKRHNDEFLMHLSNLHSTGLGSQTAECVFHSWLYDFVVSCPHSKSVLARLDNTRKAANTIDRICSRHPFFLPDLPLVFPAFLMSLIVINNFLPLIFAVKNPWYRRRGRSPTGSTGTKSVRESRRGADYDEWYGGVNAFEWLCE